MNIISNPNNLPTIAHYRFIVVGCVVLASLAILPDISYAQQRPEPSRQVRVTGTLVLDVATDSQKKMEIELPDRKVTLLRIGLQGGIGGDVGSATTTLDGRFELRAPGEGIYQICWELGNSKGCGNRFSVGKSTVFVGRVHARIKQPFVFGSVLTGDNRSCWVNDTFFNIDVTTKITGGGASARANTKGEYALIGPAPGTFRVTARCEGANAGATVSLASAPLQQDISLGNRAPRLTGLSAFNATKGVTRSRPGSSVKLVAGLYQAADPVEFTWRTAASSGILTGGNSPEQKWQLPTTPGLHSAYLMARDGKGGFAFKRVDMQIGSTDIDFSGRVIDEITRQPIKNANISVGGSKMTKTNENGWFKLKTPAQSDDRYVLNITHQAYALLSRITDRSATGNTYEMQRAQVNTFPSDQSISVIDKKVAKLCDERSDIKRLVAPSIVYDDLPVGPEVAKERREQDITILKNQPRSNRCDRRGSQLDIAAKSLVDENGQSFSGNVRVAVTTLDPSRRAIPGDYQAITASDERAELLSYGAVHVDLTDTTGRPLRIKTGESAKVTIPVSMQQQANAPQTIALWSYDEKSGFWKEEGKAKLQNTPQGLAYIGETTHFSSLNMDVAGNDPARATCVRFEVDPAFSAWSNLTIRAYVSFNGDSVQVKETPLDGQQYNAIFRIPYQTGTPTTLRLELRGTSGSQNVILLDNIIATDARPKMTGTNLWPTYPYTECGASVLLTPAPGVVPNWGDYDASDRPAFLSGPFGTFNPANGATQTVAYYTSIDPGSTKTTLGAWWLANNFGANGQGLGNPNYVRQAYLNHNDLGFGRDMHCTKNGSKIACYVTNYGLPDQNPANADAAETQDPTKRGATVAMEYDNTATVNSTTDERVQFYVFNGGDAGSVRINFADLDGFGPKPVPFLCSVCHGGGPDLTVSNKANFARFREFDLPSFRYSGGRSWDYGSSTLTASELNNFAKLNQLAHDAPSGTAISALINAWYGVLGSGAPVSPAPPTGWASDPSGYHNVFGKSCRTCHVSRDEGDTGAYFLFNKKSDFQGTDFAVCGTGSPKRRVMPNAVVTYKNFWADSLRVTQYETLTGQTTGTCKN